MRLLKRVLIGVVALVGLAAVVGFMLPRTVIVERDVTIDALPDAVFVHVSSLQAFTEWSPWSDRDPEMQITFTGPETGVGNSMEWVSDHPQVGSGRQEIVELADGELVRTQLNFDGMGTSEAWWRLTPEGNGTRVTWGLNADMGGSPVGRWMGLFMDGWVGGDYDAGLARLKEIVEG